MQSSQFLEAADTQLKIRRFKLVNGKIVPIPSKSIEDIRMRIWVMIDFFQQNNLTTRTLAETPEDISESYVLRKNDLTPLGYELFRTGYQNWLAALDRRTSEEQEKYLSAANTKILERHLKVLSGTQQEKR